MEALMQTKRMMITAAVAMSLMVTGCTPAESIDNSNSNIDSETTQSEEAEGTEAETDNEETTNEVETTEEVAEETENLETEELATEEIESEEITAEETEEPQAAIDLQVVQPNELGEVMIVMYHGLGKKNSAYTRTADSFREDLNTYYEMGFRPVNLSDYVRGDIDTPAGMTPIVLAFDDGNKSNFNIIDENGEMTIDPNSAIGIIKAFNEEHPDWALKGSFFLNGGTPFGQKEYVDYKVNWLVDNGFEVGNHSYGHEDLTEHDAAGIQKALGRNIQEIESRIEGYTVDTLALPFGKRPKDQGRYDLVTSGVYNDVAYEHKAILLVGWKPEVSVYDQGFNPLAIMRVQSGDGDFQMTHWLEDYRTNPKKRFISDGSSNTVTVPLGKETRLNANIVGEREVITYTVE